jgi:hypothetical protein
MPHNLVIFIPILAAWPLFNEEFNTLKITAFVIAFLFIILDKKKKKRKQKTTNGSINPSLMGLEQSISYLNKLLATSLPFTSYLSF